MKLEAQRGFTLVEVSIILLVLVILAAILLPNLGDFNRAARYARVKEDVGALCVALAKMLDWVGIVPAEEHFEALLRFWWRPAGAGTRYVIYSLPHLEYLVNAFFLLVPPVVPLLCAFALSRPRRFVATPQARFLTAACLSMLVYTSLVRPYWGPHDWDIFSLTAVCFASLAAYLFVNVVEEPTFGELGALLVAGSLVAVAVPLVWIGISPAHAAGPFAIDIPAPEPGETLTDAFERTLGPWL